jgi:hypothetical protein
MHSDGERVGISGMRRLPGSRQFRLPAADRYSETMMHACSEHFRIRASSEWIWYERGIEALLRASEPSPSVIPEAPVFPAARESNQLRIPHPRRLNSGLLRSNAGRATDSTSATNQDLHGTNKPRHATPTSRCVALRFRNYNPNFVSRPHPRWWVCMRSTFSRDSSIHGIVPG